MHKIELRKTFLKMRSEIPKMEQERKSLEICKIIRSFFLDDPRAPVYAYFSMKSEPDLLGLLDESRSYFLPVVNDHTQVMSFQPYSTEVELIEHKWGMKEPIYAAEKSMLPVDRSYVFVPGVAFDFCGHRLGYGKGYYDRLFAQLKQKNIIPCKIGVCFSGQISADKLPYESHDEKMDYVVCELGVVKTKDNSSV